MYKPKVYKVLVDAYLEVNHRDVDLFKRWHFMLPGETEAEFAEREIKFAKRHLESMVDEVKRHVDNVNSVVPVVNTESMCNFCEREYEEDADDGMPTCCEEAYKDKLDWKRSQNALL